MSGRSGWAREDGSWQHLPGSDAMSEGAWSFEMKWRPIQAPARTSWPFHSLLFALLACAAFFGLAKNKKIEEKPKAKSPAEDTVIMSVEDIYQRRMDYRKEMAQRGRDQGKRSIRR
jgi:hypothetical protein